MHKMKCIKLIRFVRKKDFMQFKMFYVDQLNFQICLYDVIAILRTLSFSRNLVYFMHS